MGKNYSTQYYKIKLKEQNYSSFKSILNQYVIDKSLNYSQNFPKKSMLTAVL